MRRPRPGTPGTTRMTGHAHQTQVTDGTRRRQLEHEHAVGRLRRPGLHDRAWPAMCLEVYYRYAPARQRSGTWTATRPRVAVSCEIAMRVKPAMHAAETCGVGHRHDRCGSFKLLRRRRCTVRSSAVVTSSSSSAFPATQRPTSCSRFSRKRMARRGRAHSRAARQATCCRASSLNCGNVAATLRSAISRTIASRWQACPVFADR